MATLLAHAPQNGGHLDRLRSTVHHALNDGGEHAIRARRELDFALRVCSHLMPFMSGVRLARQASRDVPLNPGHRKSSCNGPYVTSGHRFVTTA
ncbi:MAG: hypothetical protein DMD35_01990 [Gemmatimonadetes bacterium]|nr:MAG: hypothetical protein DMD35_01990 [Gemmatimonadota bacterium]